MRAKAAIMGDWVVADPPPGSTGHDPDGAFLYFGCRPWEAAYEGQTPGQPPMPRNLSAHDPDTCPTCHAALSDSRITCGGCMASGLDPRLNAELVTDDARARYQKEQEAKAKAQTFAQRKRPRPAQ